VVLRSRIVTEALIQGGRARLGLRGASVRVGGVDQREPQTAHGRFGASTRIIGGSHWSSMQHRVT
jgi:hypothetical protein